jgi:hypothetical protein
LSSSRGQLARAALLFLCGCNAAVAPQFAPAPRAMVPRGGSGRFAFAARISGDFYVVGFEQLGGGAGFVVASGFTASLDGVPVPVQWMGPHALSAQVPAGLADGPHALLVRAPTGMRGTLQAAWTTWEAPPAQLAGIASTATPQVSVGQTVQVTLSVQNTGGTTAQAVAPALTQTGPGLLQIVSPPAAVDIAPGATVSFAWTLQAATAGTTSLALSAAGTDALTGLPVSVARLPAGSVLVQRAASLTAAATASPAQVSLGQTVTFAITVSNAGDATAVGVAPAVPVLSGGGGATLATSPAPQDVPGGQSRSYVWTYTATSSGTVDFSAAASGIDANSGQTVACPAASATVKVQKPPVLSAVLTSPAVVNLNDTFTVSITVANSGDATATGVAPSGFLASPATAVQLKGGPLPATASIAGGSSQTFSWTFTAAALQASPGVAFSSSATGVDANNGKTLPPAATASATTTVQAPASLTGSFSVPAVVDRGDAIGVSLTVRNSGDASASAVAPGALSLGGTGGAAALVSGPSPASASVPGHGSATFTWSYAANLAPATVTFSDGASGSDATDGNPVAAPSTTSAAVTLQTPAALSASLSFSPANIQPGGTFTATLTVTNTGAATANNVIPAAPVAAAGNTGTATPSSTTPAPAGPVSLASGASATFQWTYTANTAGIFGISVSVSGTDGTDGASLGASASGSTQIGQVVQIAGGTPFPGTVTTTFSYVFNYQNQVWLGPSGDGSGAVRSNYDGSNAVQDTFALEWDPGAGSGPSAFSSARNPSWTTTSPAKTIGYLNCNQGTAACGPDNEAGRGLFFSGVLNGVEWLILSGARPNGGTRFLYMTNGTFPLTTGGRDHLAYLALEHVVHGSTTAATAGLAFENALYLGSSDTGTSGSQSYTAPMLTKIVNPPSLPGLNAVAGTDAVDMNLSVMPYIGVNGNPANPLRGTITAVLVDTIASFGTAPTDALYLANNGGWARSIKNNPGPCSSSGGTPCPDWVVTTPTSLNFTAKTSVPPPTTKTSDFEPQDKAVPAMVAFGGRLFAARNTTLGPQLWSCAPGQDMAGAAVTTGAVQCGPNDWSLVAPNGAAGLDVGLTQMNSSYTAISLLVAAGGYLYVGFNNTSATGATNPNPGLGIYRTSNPAPSSLADFSGLNGCSPATALPTAPCQGIGGSGFGQTPPPTHIFDGRALVSGGVTYLYVSAGTGSSTASVYRVAP